MNKRFKYLVEKYLEHSLSAPEKAEFEKFLDDRACAEYLKRAEKSERIIQEGFRLLIEKADAAASARAEAEDDTPEDIREVVKRFGGKDDPVARAAVKRMHEQMIKRRRISYLFKYFVPAASLLFGLYFVWANYLQPLPQSLYSAQYKPYEYSVISNTTVSDERIISAMTMYKSADYAGSARLCNEIISSGMQGGDIHFLYGLNLMELDSMQRAIQEFDAQINSPSLNDPEKDPPVYWYKGLCYLKMGRPVSTLLVLMKGLSVEITNKIRSIWREK